MVEKASTTRRSTPVLWRFKLFLAVTAMLGAADVCGFAHAGQTQLDDPVRAELVYFWPTLYRGGGETLYCRQNFTTRLGLTMGHVYAMDWVISALGCVDREQCLEHVPAFAYIAADLHNAYPVRQGTDDARGSKPFGYVPGDRRDFGEDCIFKADPARGLAQPPVPARGDIARAILYMMWEYGLPAPRMMREQLLVEWHEADPVDDVERKRNDRISAIQGNRNPFIDNPALAAEFMSR